MRFIYLTIFTGLFLFFGKSGVSQEDVLQQQIARNTWIILSKIEQAYHIPKGLLAAMSLVETGQGMSGKMLPWPYTIGVNAGAENIYDNRADAIYGLKKINSLGFSRFNIKIGGQTHNSTSYHNAVELLQQVAESGIQISVKPLNFSRRFDTKAQAISAARRLVKSGYENVDIGLMQINWKYHSDNFSSISEAFEPQKNAMYAVEYLKKHKQTRDWWGSVGRYHSGTEKFAKIYISKVWEVYKKLHKIHNLT